MGTIFDKNTANIYQDWCRSSQGRAIDRSIERLIVSLLDPKPGERVLDIGCGPGNHLLIFSKLGLNISGIDASAHMISKAEERFGHCCTLKTGAAESLPFEDNEFDLAVLINSLEFIDDPLQALKEAGRVANQKVFIGVLNSLSWNGLLRKTGGLFGDPLFGRARFYNFWQMKTLIRQAYGPVPVSWGCIKVIPSCVERLLPEEKDLTDERHSPFGFFLGFAVTMVYRLRTDNLPIKVKSKKSSLSLIGARTMETLKAGKRSERR